MASITIQKHTLQSASAGQINHIYRENGTYRNKQVDLSKSVENLYLGGEDGADARARLRQVLTEIDKKTPPKRIRSDRKTVASLVIPAPRENLSREQALGFFEAFVAEFQKVKPDCKLVAGAIHADEVHEYTDPTDRCAHKSRLHMHLLVVPDLPGAGCNMKSWLTKSRYREMNAIADRACERVLGYTYQDGTRQQTRGSVEVLKERSLTVQAEELEKLKSATLEAQETAQKASEAVQEAQNRLGGVLKQEKAAQGRLEALQKEIDALEAAYSDDTLDDIQRLQLKKRFGGRAVYELSAQQMKALEAVRFKVRKQKRDLEAAQMAEQSAKSAHSKALAAYQREHRKAEDYEKSYIKTLERLEAMKTAVSRQPERIQETIIRDAGKALQSVQSREQGRGVER